MSDSRPIIAVLGATGAQGGAVTRALVDNGAFRVRAITRNPESYSGPADEVAQADLADQASLVAAFDGAYGVFALSNFVGTELDELTQGRHAVDAAASAGVRHFVWSTLPNVEEISDGAFDVPHFTNKAKVDALVEAANFEYFTFVEPPFYFENFETVLAPQPLPDGGQGWVLPIPADARVIHAGSIEDLGGVIAGIFNSPESAGAGAYLSSAAELMSFADFAEILNSQGHDISIVEVPPAVYAGFYPGADEMAQMMNYWVGHNYLGHEGEEHINAARAISTTPSTSFTSWAQSHMPAGKAS